MSSFTFKGFTYDLWIRPSKKGKANKYEALKWKTGLKCTWERITLDEFENARKAKFTAPKEHNRQLTEYHF